MNSNVGDLAKLYQEALIAYVAGSDEEVALLRGYECGRQAIIEGVGILDLLAIHHDILLSSVLGPALKEEVRRLTRMASDFLSHSLSPLEMTLRGFKETNIALRALNETLERRVQERTRDLENALYTLQKVLSGTIEAMALAVEMRDPYTAGHQWRVAQLACAIAQVLGLSAEQVSVVRLAATVHDVGKIRVPSEILSRPGRLSELEFSLIKEHARIGYDILKPIAFPWPIAEIVFQHHERMDGSGYPSGLAGEGILLEARVLAVADVVEAMASHRPYRPALGVDRALEEISHKRGILFNLNVVEACLELFREKGFRFD